MNPETIQKLVDVAINFAAYVTNQLSILCPKSEIEEGRLFEGGLHVVTLSIPATAIKSIGEAISVKSALQTELHRRTGTYGSDEFWNAWSGVAKGAPIKHEIGMLCDAVMGSAEFQEEFMSVLNDSITQGRHQAEALFVGIPD